MKARAGRLALVAGLVLASFAGGMLYRQAPATQATVGERRILRYICPMHPQYTSDQPGDAPCCGMRLVPVYEGDETPAASGAAKLPAALVQVTPERRQIVGVQVGEVTRKPFTRVLRTVGRVAADETRLYRVTAATSGWIEEAMPNSVGSLVRKDEVLATFYSPEFLGAQQSYFYALAARDRFVQQNAGEAQLASNNVQVQQSADNLRALGMTRPQIDEITRTGNRAHRIEVRSPSSGFVLARNVSPGQRFQAGEELYRIADLSHIWVLADLFEQEAREVRAGRAALIRYEAETISTRVSNVLPLFDDEARTLKVRLELPNEDYQFRPGMFVDVEFPIDLPPTLTVPTGAVVDSGMRKTVFVDRGNGFFEARQVETGWRFEDQVEVIHGLMPGERIVLSGAFLIDSESRMKAAAAVVRGTPAEDPVCGMEVDQARAEAADLVSRHQGRTYYFCSESCRDQFAQAPARYLKEQ